MQKIWQITLGILIGLFIAGLILLVSRPPHGSAIQLDPTPTGSPLVVSVVGQVNNPGVYELSQGSRIQDAVLAAGGFTSEANQVSVNLAAPIADGSQIYVASQSEEVQVITTADSRAAEVSANGFTAEHPLNLNTATAEELMMLPGIGEGKAADILAYRQEHGAFQSIEEIMDVPGIGTGIYEKIKDLIAITG